MSELTVCRKSDNSTANPRVPSPWTMNLHLLSLSTCEPHPLAQEPVLKYPVDMPRRAVHLDFQILDDMIHVMSKEMKGGEEKIPEHIVGWQWTTGRIHVVSNCSTKR